MATVVVVASGSGVEVAGEAVASGSGAAGWGEALAPAVASSVAGPAPA
jgi:hypothetical protein